MTKEETIIDVSKQFRNLQTQYAKVVEQNRELQQELREKTTECEELKKAIDTVEKVIEEKNGETILTFPDFSPQENYKFIMKQLNDGYIKILDIISKAKDGG